MRATQPLLGLMFVLLAAAPPVAAVQASYAARDSVYRRMLTFSALVKGWAITPHWMADGHSLWYMDRGTQGRIAWKVNARTNLITPLLDPRRTREALRRAALPVPDGHGLPFDDLQLVDEDHAAVFSINGLTFRLDLATYDLTAVGLGAGSSHPGSRWIPYADANNISLRSSTDSQAIALTSDGNEQQTWTHGVRTGSQLHRISWSPDGSWLLAYKTDRRNVHRLPVVDWLKAGGEDVEWVTYPMVGGAIPQEELYAFDVRSRRATKLDTGNEADHQVYVLAWTGDGRSVLILRANRMRSRVDVLIADPRTGQSRQILSEHQPTFIEGLALNPASLFTAFRDGRRFVWRSERDGWSHLYLYRLDGSLIRQVTRGPAPVDSVVGIDEERGWIYFLARGDRRRPYDFHLYRADTAGQRPTMLTEGPGEHWVNLDPRRNYFLDTYSTAERPPVVKLRRTDGTLVRTLAKADISALTEVGWRAPEEFVAKAADDSTELFGVLYRPYDFEAKKRYPVIDLQYMGNFAHSAPRRFVNSFLGDEAQALTQLGFIVFIVDGRGTTARGKAFQDYTYRSIGKFEVSDHVAALRQLAAAHPFIDTSRVGIAGYSWGGYYTIRAMVTAPEIFKVGVAGAPTVDLRAAPGPIEPYMGLPQENPDGYEQASNLHLLDRLKGKLLVAIGTGDVNVTFSHSMRLVDAAIRAGKYIDLLVLPGEGHALSPRARDYYLEARARYFIEHLRP